jgi:peptidoglycan/xylan/chitin deacetylase (PgdA/CDA1 family)
MSGSAPFPCANPAPRYALSFDDGPGLATGRILDALRGAGVRATFFILGRNVEEAPWCAGDRGRARALVGRMLTEDHVVGNHTYAHVPPDRWRDLAADLARNDEVIRACRREAGMTASAIDAPIPVRLPYGVKIVTDGSGPFGRGAGLEGRLDPRLAVLASLGRAHVHWTGDFEDWTLRADDAARLAAGMLEHVERCAALGLDAVIDLHDGGSRPESQWGYDRTGTALAVEQFLAEARRLGFSSFTVPA